MSVSEIVEHSDAVGLRPHPNTPQPCYLRIVGLDVHLAVQCNTNPVARELGAQGVPWFFATGASTYLIVIRRPFCV